MANTVEHRKMERFSIQLPAQLLPVEDAEEQEAIEVLTSDVCAGGAFFQTDQPLPLGAEVKVKMVLPLDELKKLEGKKTAKGPLWISVPVMLFFCKKLSGSNFSRKLWALSRKPI